MIAAYMPDKNRRGRPRVTEMRAAVNSIFFIAQSGCQWRLLPKEFRPHEFLPVATRPQNKKAASKAAF
jgi:transposase